MGTDDDNALIGCDILDFSSALDINRREDFVSLPLPEAAWINKPNVESKEIVLAENAPIPGVVGYGSGADRRPRDILNGDISSQAGQRHGNDIKFKSEVSQYH